MIANLQKNSQHQIVTLSIAVPCPLPKLFHYLPTAELNLQQLKPGIRVKIPFGKRELIGVFIGVVTDSTIEVKKLRQIIKIIDQEPIFDADMQYLLQWIANYYHYPLGEVYSIAMPSLLRKGQGVILSTQKIWKPSSSAPTIALTEFKRAPKQQKAFQLLMERKKLSETDLTEFKITRETIQALMKKKLLVEENVEIIPAISNNTSDPLTLNEEQKYIVNKILMDTKAENNRDKFKVFLIDGITGSGKTEVYFYIIAEQLKLNKQVLVLVPEIGLTPQTVQRFQQRFAVTIAIMHSDLTDKARLDNWVLAKNNKISIVIGTRSAIFTPMPNLGLIIIDEEHDNSFKQQDTLRYSARDVAIMLAKQKNIPIILGSATPSLESYYNAQQQRYVYLKLTKRAGNASLPQIKLIDVRDQKLESGLSKTVLQAIQQHLNNEGQVLLFLNRRGFSPNLICHSCGYVFKCSRCDANYTFHHEKNKLICHHCEKQIIPKQCLECQQNHLLPLGLGTERIETVLKKYFSQESIVRIDRDSTRKKGSFNQFLEKINAGIYKILVGTQMLAKGHHFPNVTLVVIVNADGGLLSNDLRASERMGQLILQVAGRSGRAEKPGEVLIQTWQPDNAHLQCLLQKNYQLFSDYLLQQRQKTQLPPFSFLCLFRADAFLEKDTMSFLTEVKHKILSTNVNIHCLGPVAAPLSKKAGKYRSQLLLQAVNRKQLQSLLDQLINEISMIELSKKVKWSLDVDPMDLY